MALIRTGGAQAPSKTAVIATGINSSYVQATYDNGTGENVVDKANAMSSTWTASDLVSVSYSSDIFTVTFKVDCNVVGSYGSTSISGAHSANTSITFNRSDICAAYIYD